MGKIMEAVFSIIYLLFTSTAGIIILARAKKNTEHVLFGIMTLTLVFGDAFHLVPRIMAALGSTADLTAALGYGKLVTSITMTVFYVILYYVYSRRHSFKNTALTVVMFVLAAVRIVLCLLPQNDWAGESPVIWGVYRNVPFLVIGIIMVVLYFIKRKDKPFSFMWLAITLSFLFYIPVVLFADTVPIIGMMMLPKTCMYMWIVVMGLKNTK